MLQIERQTVAGPQRNSLEGRLRVRRDRDAQCDLLYLPREIYSVLGDAGSVARGRLPDFAAATAWASMARSGTSSLVQAR